jgi:V8-like Glu-specific endopeptidase
VPHEVVSTSGPSISDSTEAVKRNFVQRSAQLIQSIFERSPPRAYVDTSAEPWSGLCYIEVWDGSGDARRGTGFLIDQRWVVTAAHVIWKAESGSQGFPTIVRIYPARNGTISSEPIYGDVAVDPDYHSSADAGHDIGLIRLRTAAPTLSYRFKLSQVADPVLVRKDGAGFGVSGYPADFSPIRPVVAYGPLEDVLPDQVTYKISTCEGESGGPITYKFSGGRVVFAVHGSGVGGGSCVAKDGHNTGARINDAVLSWISDMQARD